MNESFQYQLKQALDRGLPGEKSREPMNPVSSRHYTPEKNPGKAAVLILIFPRKGKLNTILIKRPEYNGPHSGQVSFPGGKSDKNDQSLIETALREAGEEIGINAGEISVLGTLTPLQIAVSNLEVLPVVGYAEKQPSFAANPGEVEYLIILPLDRLRDPQVRTRKKITVNGFILTVPGYEADGEFIWGATAMIMAEFEKVLSQMHDPNP